MEREDVTAMSLTRATILLTRRLTGSIMGSMRFSEHHRNKRPSTAPSSSVTTAGLQKVCWLAEDKLCRGHNSADRGAGAIKIMSLSWLEQQQQLQEELQSEQDGRRSSVMGMDEAYGSKSKSKRSSYFFDFNANANPFAQNGSAAGAGAGVGVGAALRQTRRLQLLAVKPDEMVDSKAVLLLTM